MYHLQKGDIMMTVAYRIVCGVQLANKEHWWAWIQ